MKTVIKTLDEQLKFYEENEEFYLNLARKNTKYDEYGRIILSYDEPEDDID